MRFQDDQQIIQNYAHSSVESAVMQTFSDNGVRVLPAVAALLPRFKHLVPKLERLCDRYNDRVLAATATDLADFNVLTHGDMWSNNMMFRYEATADTIADIKFVDFQACYVGSPVLDIIYTLNGSSANHLRSNDWDALMQHYSEQLTETLRRLEFTARPVPTLEQLQADRLRRTHHSMGLYTLAVRNVEEVGDDEFAKMMGNSEECDQYRVQIMMNPKIRDAVEHFIEFFDKNGVFD